jgi:transcriptional regulator with XRE-family HTH domain
MTKTAIARFTEDSEGLRLFQQAGLIFEVTELMCAALDEQSITRAELAERMGKSKGRISQILNGETNLTLQTIADVFTALGKKLNVDTEDVRLEESVAPVRVISLEPRLMNVLPCMDLIVNAEQAIGMGA